MMCYQIITINSVMSKPSAKKYRHNSVIDVPFTQRTAYFKQETSTDPYKTLPSKSALKCILLQNENTPLNNKYINNENQCLKNIQDKLLGQKKNSLKKVVDNCMKQIKNNGQLDNIEKRIDSMIEKKMKKMVESYVEKYFMKFIQDKKQFMRNYRIANENEINVRLMKIQKGYDDILRTYDNFLVIAQKIKDKAMKSQKYVKKTQIQSILKKNDLQIDEIHAKLNKIATDLYSLKKSDISLSFDQQKIKPISLKYNQVQQFGMEQLRIVVNTYNENFMQIDQKLQEIYSYLT